MDKRVVTCEVELDFSPLLAAGHKFAVHCGSKEDAENFLKQLRKHYPEQCRAWSEGETHFGRYSTTCYSPWLNTREDTLKYCNLEYYEDYGYTIIKYEELVVAPDIAESEQSMDFLFGGGV